MAMATKEFTWGGELSKTKNEIEWNPAEEEDEEDEEMLLTHCLFLKQALLGEEAKEGERNIIEVETRNWNNQKICQPFVSLKLGLNECCPLDLTLLPPVKLRLKSGSGPVYLMGTHAMEIEDDEDYMGDSSFEFSAETPEHMKSKKRRGSANNGSITNGSAKKRKVENGTTDEDDEEDEEEAEGEDDIDDDEEDDDEEEEEEGEEDEEEGEDDDEDEDEEEEESMEEDEEESPEKPKKKTKKAKQNGHSKEIMNGSSKKKGKKGKKSSLDEIKKELSQSTNIKHKKEEKFTNMVRSKYHMTDAKKLQDLWSWYKGSQLVK